VTPEETDELQRIAANHQVLVALLEDFAEYSFYLRDKARHPHLRAVGHGMRDRIHQAFERLEIKQ
jgi:hypothetical protein